MTSDAKVGLLLGLLFIVVIAFLVNGLPTIVRNARDAERPDTAVVDVDPDTRGISEKATQVVQAFDPPAAIEAEEAQAAALQEEVRSVHTLPPKALDVNLQTAEQTRRSVVVTPVAAAKTPSVQKYAVKPGETLASIAVTMYGKEIGNKRATVQALFAANQDILDSPDTIQVGQELTIPHLDQAGGSANSSPNILTKVGEMAGKKVTSLKNAMSKPAYEEYVVRPHDNLWKISARFLGDGKHFDQIVKLNSDQLQDEDDITVGMKLKVPVR